MLEIEELKQKLYKKIEQELEDYKEELKTKTPEEIIESAYQLVVKDEIKEELKCRDFERYEIIALLKEKDLLTEFYTDWYTSDGRLGEIISYTMDDTIKIISDNYIEERSQKNKESR